MSIFDLSWGESVAVRRAFAESIIGKRLTYNNDKIMNMGYPEHLGDPVILTMTRSVIKKQTGRTYEYLALTNGATGAINIALRALKLQGYDKCFTNSPPYFTYYPKMIQNNSIIHHIKDEKSLIDNKSVLLIDSPSNPNAQFIDRSDFTLLNIPVIWDSVYHNRIYTNGLFPVPNHTVVCGSYSKLLGINGIRLGWIATDDSLLFSRISSIIESEYCGLSKTGYDFLRHHLTNLSFPGFEAKARFKLDMNRENWSKLEKFFNNSVANSGMFYYSSIDSHCKTLLEKSNIRWLPGSSLGTDDSFGRFNLGQDCSLIANAVKEVIKNDTRKVRIEPNDHKRRVRKAKEEGGP